MCIFEDWVCVFAGKMGWSWKLAQSAVYTKEEAEKAAMKNCNVVAVPIQLYEYIDKLQKRVMEAECKLREIELQKTRGSYDVAI